VTPSVSVLLPARAAAAHLPQALESLLGQTLPDFEILAVDDHSPDQGATLAVLRAFAARDARVRVLKAGRHLGIANALNWAASQARGRYLARMDADDLCLPERLEEQARLLDARPDVDVAGCLVRFGGDPREAAGYARHVAWTNTLISHEDMALGAFRDAPLAHPSAMLRADALRAHGGYRDGPFPEDYELWLRMLEGGARFAKVERELLVWNDPPGRLSRTDPRYGQDAFHDLKAAYLGRWLSRRNPLHPDVWVVGAGRVTRRRAERLCAHGVRIRAFLDIDPRKIGRSHQGRPVLHHEALPPVGEAFVVSFVATPGAAEHVELFLRNRGYVRGRDFVQAG